MENGKLYQGTKQVWGRPISKREYCQLRGWDVPADEDPDEIVYLVEYTDGGKANVEGFAGYVSMSPADVFERSYRPCETFLARIEIELAELADRVNKLGAFISGAGGIFDGLPEADRELLKRQHTFMLGYRAVLKDRRDRAAAAEGN